jgi:hypothetical protein
MTRSANEKAGGREDDRYEPDDAGAIQAHDLHAMT